MGKLEQWQIGVSRYYQYLMNDQAKNECMLLIRGEHPQLQSNPIGLNRVVHKLLSKYTEIYLKQSKIEVKVVTWNVSGIKAPEDFDMEHLFGDIQHIHDIVVVGI
jgi:hypothetical protein